MRLTLGTESTAEKSKKRRHDAISSRTIVEDCIRIVVFVCSLMMRSENECWMFSSDRLFIWRDFVFLKLRENERKWEGGRERERKWLVVGHVVVSECDRRKKIILKRKCCPSLSIEMMFLHRKSVSQSTIVWSWGVIMNNNDPKNYHLKRRRRFRW